MAIDLGSLVWSAKVQGVEQADSKIQSLEDSVADTGGVTKKLDANTMFLAGTLLSMGSTAAGTALKMGGLATVMSTILPLIASISPSLAALTGALAAAGGILGTVTGTIGGFVGWVAAGSAGALAFAAALGAAAGVFGVWVLEVTGVMDKVRAFASFLGANLPAAVTDAILVLTSIFAGGLAVIGGFISGFVRGTMEGGLVMGVRQGIEDASAVLDIFVGAWERTVARVEALAGDLGGAAADAIQRAWNSVIPAQVTLSAISIAGQEVFGGATIDLPQLQGGGIVEQTGVAVVHRGETVLPARANAPAATGGGGGDTNVVIERVQIGDQSLDIRRLDRRELRDVMDQLAKALGDEVGARL